MKALVSSHSGRSLSVQSLVDARAVHLPHAAMPPAPSRATNSYGPTRSPSPSSTARLWLGARAGVGRGALARGIVSGSSHSVRSFLSLSVALVKSLLRWLRAHAGRNSRAMREDSARQVNCENEVAAILSKNAKVTSKPPTARRCSSSNHTVPITLLTARLSDSSKVDCPILRVVNGSPCRIGGLSGRERTVSTVPRPIAAPGLAAADQFRQDISQPP